MKIKAIIELLSIFTEAVATKKYLEQIVEKLLVINHLGISEKTVGFFQGERKKRHCFFPIIVDIFHLVQFKKNIW